MNKGLIIGLLIVLGLGGYIFLGGNAKDQEMMENKVEEKMEKSAVDSGALEEVMEEKEVMESDEGMMEEDGMMAKAGEYKEYDEKIFIADSDMKRVYFFYADWCSTCRPLDVEISKRKEEIPEGVVIYKTDYDTETTLKQKYGITYQHTFVQVDENGEEVVKWTGGDMDELLTKII